MVLTVRVVSWQVAVDEDRAFIFYFVHPVTAAKNAAPSAKTRRSSLQVGDKSNQNTSNLPLCLLRRRNRVVVVPDACPVFFTVCVV